MPGLNYATLNALVVTLADAAGIALPVASRVFTIGYFVGLFGFPPIATRAIMAVGVGSTIATLVAVAVVNVGLALALVFGSSPRCTGR